MVITSVALHHFHAPLKAAAVLEVDLLYGKPLHALSCAETGSHALGCTVGLVTASMLGACSGTGVHSSEHPYPRQKWKELIT